VIALVRDVPDAFVRATRTVDLGPIDLARARAQHADYVDGLRFLGYDVRRLPPDDGPDSVFVEDQAVVVDGRALVTRSGHPGRRGEADAVADALRGLGLEVVRMTDGILDGGDVLRSGRVLWVGRSSRTDDGGLRALAAAFPSCEVRPVELPPDVLHLKCVCSVPVPGLAVVAGLTQPFTDRVVRVAPEDRWAANVVGAGSRVLVGAGHPRVEAALRDAGLEVRAVDASEFRKGDGSLTCLSILVG
jgi:dimethylargininase